jgi:hypothetical protein
MPRGFTGVRSTSAEIESRRGSGGGGLGALWFRLKDGEETVVRFLEQDDDIFWCHMHEVPVENRQFGRDVACCDQDKDGTPCPGCEQDLPRKFKGFINVIWRDAPVFKRDSENKMVKDDHGDPIITGYKPQVAVWGSGIRLFEQLDEVNTDYRGLMSRRFKVRRKGEKLSTKYHISPENVDSGAQDMSAEEKDLAAKKYDLNEFVKPPSYDGFLKELGQGGGSQNGGGRGEEQQRRVNPFMRNES